MSFYITADDADDVDFNNQVIAPPPVPAGPIIVTSGPTLAGFISFITYQMGLPIATGGIGSYQIGVSPVGVLPRLYPNGSLPVFDPTTSPYVQVALDMALQIVNPHLQRVRGVPNANTIYTTAVYNLAGDILINIAQDMEGDPVYGSIGQEQLPLWQWLRAKFQINNFMPGVVASTGDNGTSTSLQVIEAMSRATIMNLGNLKTPWGRAYLGFAQSWGSLWGIS